MSRPIAKARRCDCDECGSGKFKTRQSLREHQAAAHWPRIHVQISQQGPSLRVPASGRLSRGRPLSAPGPTIARRLQSTRSLAQQTAASVRRRRGLLQRRLPPNERPQDARPPVQALSQGARTGPARRLGRGSGLVSPGRQAQSALGEPGVGRGSCISAAREHMQRGSAADDGLFRFRPALHTSLRSLAWRPIAI
jgi:hypothetical protein